MTRGEGIGLEVRVGLAGIPLKSVAVRALDTARRQVFSDVLALDVDGRGDLPSLPPGAYTLTVGASRYASRTFAVSVPTPTLRVALTPGGLLEIHAGEKTTVLARLKLLTSSGDPCPVTRSEDGTFVLGLPVLRFDNVAPGAYTLQIVGGDTRSLSVREGQTTLVELP